jgi:hypothetical protein
MKPWKRKNVLCDYPECQSHETKRIDISTSWFRGDDVVLWVCKEHQKDKCHMVLLQTEKAKRQMA